MAAVDDPWILDRQLRRTIAAHQTELDRRPPDRQHALDTARRDHLLARTKLATADAAVTATHNRLDSLAALVGFTRDGRAERRRLHDELQNRQAVAIEAAGDVTRTEGRVERVTAGQAAHDTHEQAHGWRRQAIDRIWDRLDQHWTDVALACVQADQPLAHGVGPLRIAHRHLTEQLAAVQATVPPDRSRDLDGVRQELTSAISRRDEAGRRAVVLQAELDGHTSRRWPRRDRNAIERGSQQLDIARGQLADNVRVENDTRRRLDDLRQHHHHRAAVLGASADERHILTEGIGQIDGALERTRTQRVVQLADHPSELHLQILGPVPNGPAGRAVWCHQASTLEHHHDYSSDRDDRCLRHLVHELADTPTLAQLADHHIPTQSRTGEHDTWRHITQLAIQLRDATIDHSPHPVQRTRELGLELDL